MSRWANYRKRRLSVALAFGHAAKCIAFRLYKMSWDQHTTYILDRYFYDSFVHFDLETPRQRAYATVIKLLVPTPNISLVLKASSHAIARRRPSYSIDYLESVGTSYARLHKMFPGLVEVQTDSSELLRSRLEEIVADRLLW
jgi:hypothetical protein